jgi:hypothetical protein
MVVVHDGVSTINIAQLKTVLSTTGSARTELAAESMRDVAGEGTSASRRLASMRTLHNNMEHAHRSLRGFCWMKLERPPVPRRCREAPLPAVLGQLGHLPTSAPALTQR